jgi:phosphohistidine phosphatase
MGIQLYLVQHGEAVPESEDPERPLTARGRDDIRRLAAFLAEANVHPTSVLHSGKLRAADSASLLASAIGGTTTAQEKGLLPGDSPVPLTEVITTWKADTLVVGHQPFLGRLVSRLLLGKEQPTIVEFTPGTMACLARRPVTGAWYLSWVLVPELLRR